MLPALMEMFVEPLDPALADEANTDTEQSRKKK